MSTIKFLPDWTTVGGHDLRAGGSLRIEYARERLPRCRARGPNYTVPGWAIASYVRFHPHGPEETNELNWGGSAEFAIPDGASGVEIWFKNFDSEGCVTWDSHYGENYRFDVLQ